MPSLYQFGHQLTEGMVPDDVTLAVELNVVSNVRSQSCGAIRNEKPCISTIRARSEVPSRCELHVSANERGLGMALKQPKSQRVDVRKPKPLDDPKEIQILSSYGPGRSDGLGPSCEESPPLEIISVRKILHPRPTKPSHARLEHTQIASSLLKHRPSTQQHNRNITHPQHPPLTHNMGNKRRNSQTAESEKKRYRRVAGLGGSPLLDPIVSSICTA